MVANFRGNDESPKSSDKCESLYASKNDGEDNCKNDDDEATYPPVTVSIPPTYPSTSNDENDDEESETTSPDGNDDGHESTPPSTDDGTDTTVDDDDDDYESTTTIDDSLVPANPNYSVEVSCGKAVVKLTNVLEVPHGKNGEAAVFMIEIDGKDSTYDTIVVLANTTETRVFTFERNSGDHTVTVMYYGQEMDYVVRTNCDTPPTSTVPTTTQPPAPTTTAPAPSTTLPAPTSTAPAPTTTVATAPSTTVDVGLPPVSTVGVPPPTAPTPNPHSGSVLPKTGSDGSSMMLMIGIGSMLAGLGALAIGFGQPKRKRYITF
jgi:LPXTG-motif cell wall-anchored protein